MTTHLEHNTRHQAQHPADRTTDTTSAGTVRWASGTNIVAAAWLLLSPYVLGYGDVAAAVWNASIVGVLVGGMAWYRTARPDQGIGLSWTNAVLGAWLVFAPSTLSYTDTGAAVGNDITVGLIVLVLAVVSAVAGSKRSTSR